MKKVIISVLFLLVCLSILLITPNANEDVNNNGFNKEYALNLIDKAYQIYLTTNEISPTSGSSSGDGFYYDSENKNSPYYDPLNETNEEYRVALFPGERLQWRSRTTTTCLDFIFAMEIPEEFNK